MYIDQAFINRTGAHLNLPSIMHRTRLSRLNAGERLDQDSTSLSFWFSFRYGAVIRYQFNTYCQYGDPSRFSPSQRATILWNP